MAGVSSCWQREVLFFARACARTELRRCFLIALSLCSGLSLSLLAAPLTFEEAKTRLSALKIEERMEGIAALKPMRRADSADALQAALASDKDPQVRLALLDALGVMPEYVSAQRLAPLLSNELAPLRQRTAYVLGLAGGRQAEKVLAQALLRETDPDVKAMILQSLSLCGSAASIDEIQKALYDQRPQVRAKAVEALRFIPGKDSEKTLESALSDNDAQIREQARKAMAKKRAKKTK